MSLKTSNSHSNNVFSSSTSRGVLLNEHGDDTKRNTRFSGNSKVRGSQLDSLSDNNGDDISQPVRITRSNDDSVNFTSRMTSSHHLPTIQYSNDVLISSNGVTTQKRRGAKSSSAAASTRNGIESGLRGFHFERSEEVPHDEEPVLHRASRSRLMRGPNGNTSTDSTGRASAATSVLTASGGLSGTSTAGAHNMTVLQEASRRAHSSAESPAESISEKFEDIQKKYQDMKTRCLLVRRQYRMFKESKDKEIESLNRNLEEKDKEIADLKHQLTTERARRRVSTSRTLTSNNSNNSLQSRRRTPSSRSSASSSSGGGRESTTTTTTARSTVRRAPEPARRDTSSGRMSRSALETSHRLSRLRSETDELEHALQRSREQYQQRNELLEAARFAHALALQERSGDESTNSLDVGDSFSRVSSLLGEFEGGPTSGSVGLGADRLLSMHIPEDASYEQLLELDNTIVKVGLDITLKYQFPRRSATDQDAERTCSICMENYAENELLVTLPCLCSFHDNCCMKWLECEKRCPICQIDLENATLYEQEVA